MQGYSIVQSAVGLATRTTSGSGTGLNVGEYVYGTLFILVHSVSNTPTFQPYWAESPNGNHGTGGRYAPMQFFGTYANATGLKAITLTTLGKWGRLGWTLSGADAQVKFQAWLVGKGTL